MFYIWHVAKFIRFIYYSLITFNYFSAELKTLNVYMRTLKILSTAVTFFSAELKSLNVYTRTEPLITMSKYFNQCFHGTRRHVLDVR